MNKFIWYLGNLRIVIGYGENSQDAFSRLNRVQRQAITLQGEYCVKESEFDRDINKCEVIQ